MRSRGRILAYRWRSVLVLAAVVVALAQVLAVAHRIHDLSTAHPVPCQVCLLSSEQGAALLPALPTVPPIRATAEAPALRNLPVVSINERSTRWARAPPV